MTEPKSARHADAARARAAKLPPERRKEIAQEAARARWDKVVSRAKFLAKLSNMDLPGNDAEDNHETLTWIISTAKQLMRKGKS